jgi:hypothetical protein
MADRLRELGGGPRVQAVLERHDEAGERHAAIAVRQGGGRRLRAQGHEGIAGADEAGLAPLDDAESLRLGDDHRRDEAFGSVCESLEVEADKRLPRPDGLAWRNFRLEAFPLQGHRVDSDMNEDLRPRSPPGS